MTKKFENRSRSKDQSSRSQCNVTYWRLRCHISVTDGRINFKFGGGCPLDHGNTCPAFQEIRSSKPEIEIWPISGKKCKLEIAAQGVAQCKVSAARVVVDAALRHIGSPVIVNGFENGFHQWIQRIFLVVVEVENCFPNFFKVGSTLRPCSG